MYRLPVAAPFVGWLTLPCAGPAAVPLFDTRRYHLLLAGASWTAEYGSPDDPEDWAFIREYSPYQNLEKGVDYPEPEPR